MAKGYWIALVTVTDPDQYRLYAEAKFAQMEGEGHPRNVVIEFPSLQAAIDCYNSPEYQAAKTNRRNAGIANIVLVEGV
jgi:uncharacterized protein (DUF1330 family)